MNTSVILRRSNRILMGGHTETKIIERDQKDYSPRNQVEFILEVQDWISINKSINVINSVNILKKTKVK